MRGMHLKSEITQLELSDLNQQSEIENHKFISGEGGPPTHGA